MATMIPENVEIFTTKGENNFTAFSNLLPNRILNTLRGTHPI